MGLDPTLKSKTNLVYWASTNLEEEILRRDYFQNEYQPVISEYFSQESQRNEALGEKRRNFLLGFAGLAASVAAVSISLNYRREQRNKLIVQAASE